MMNSPIEVKQEVSPPPVQSSENGKVNVTMTHLPQELKHLATYLTYRKSIGNYFDTRFIISVCYLCKLKSFGFGLSIG